MVDELQGEDQNLIVFSSNVPESNGSLSDMELQVASATSSSASASASAGMVMMPRTCSNEQEDQAWSDRSSTCPILLHDQPGSSNLRDIFAGLEDDSNSNNSSGSSLVLPDLTATSADADQLAAISTSAISMPSTPSKAYNLQAAGAHSAVTASATIASPASVAATLLRSSGSDSMPDLINTATTACNIGSATMAGAHGVLQKRRASAGLLNLGDRIHALQQLVSPFGKTDTASVLLEAIGYIKFLQDQVQVLSSPYMKSKAGRIRQMGQEQSASDLRSRGLCLVPVSCTLRLASSNMNIGADYWASSNHQDAIRHSLQRSDRERDERERSASGGLDR